MTGGQHTDGTEQSERGVEKSGSLSVRGTVSPSHYVPVSLCNVIPQRRSAESVVSDSSSSSIAFSPGESWLSSSDGGDITTPYSSIRYCYTIFSCSLFTIRQWLLAHFSPLRYNWLPQEHYCERKVPSQTRAVEGGLYQFGLLSGSPDKCLG